MSTLLLQAVKNKFAYLYKSKLWAVNFLNHSSLSISLTKAIAELFDLSAEIHIFDISVKRMVFRSDQMH